MATLRAQLLVPTALLAAVVGLTLGLLAVDAWRQARALDREVEEIRAASGLAFALSDAADDEQRWVVSHHFRRDGPSRARVDRAEEHVAALMAKMQRLALRPRAAELWRDLEASRLVLLRARDELLAASGARDERAVALTFEKWHLVADRSNALLASFATFHLRSLERTVTDLDARRTRALWAAGGAVLLGVGLAVAFSALLARTFVRPIVEMADAAERIAERGLAAPVGGAGRGDEIGKLARAFNRMTERLVSANVRLGDAVRARDEFISIASHELKTPLTPMKLHLQSLLRAARGGEPPDPSRVVHTVRSFERLVTRLGKLVDNMLDVSRIASGRLVLSPEDVDAGELLREATEQARPDVEAAGCPLRIDCRYDGALRGDRARLAQVLETLLSNAAKYAPGTEVTIRCRREAGEVLLEVSDRGDGIDAVDQERIFGRFERAVQDPRSNPGLGLGLYIAREIARGHGGDLVVTSAPREGATFVVRLPLEGARSTEAHLPGGAAGPDEAVRH